LTTRLGGVQMTGNWTIRGAVGVHLGVSAEDEALLFTDLNTC
jgi:hypothetical protein